MRGCVGAGMLAALNHLGLRDAFDVIYGSSAGSLMGAYFLSGQTPLEGPGVRVPFVCTRVAVVICRLGLGEDSCVRVAVVDRTKGKVAAPSFIHNVAQHR